MQSLPLRSLIAAGLLAGATVLIYGCHLSSAPLAGDERYVAQQAVDGGGQRWPLLFAPQPNPQGAESIPGPWLQPIPVYAVRMISVVAPADLAARAASVTVAAVNVMLFFVLARRLFPGESTAAIGALMLLITPAHIVFGRLGIDAIYSLPFVLLWLIGLTTFLESARPAALVLAAGALGIGVYSQPAAPISMALWFLLTLIVLWKHSAGRQAFLVTASTFGLALVPLLVWFVAYPQTYPDTFGRWAIHAAHIRNPLDGLRAFLNWNTLGTRVSTYWGFIDPSWLFFSAPSGTGGWLRGWSPFPLIVLAPILFGMARLFRDGAAPLTLILLGGLAIAPMAAATLGEAHALQSALALVPFAILIATEGIVELQRRSSPYRMVAWAAVLIAALHFAWLYPAITA